MELKSNLIQMRLNGRVIHMRRMDNLTLREWEEINAIEVKEGDMFSEAKRALKVVEMCVVNDSENVAEAFSNMTVESFGEFLADWTALHEVESLDG